MVEAFSLEVTFLLVRASLSETESDRINRSLISINAVIRPTENTNEIDKPLATLRDLQRIK